MVYRPGSASGPSGAIGVTPGLPLNSNECANAGGGSYRKSQLARFRPTLAGRPRPGASQELSIGGRAVSRTARGGALDMRRTTLPLASSTSIVISDDGFAPSEEYMIAPSGGFGAWGTSRGNGVLYR